MSVETIACRFVGGPYEGTRFTTLPWPLVDFIDLPLEGGTYNKIAESQLTDTQLANAKGHVMRGVQYEWDPDVREEDSFVS